MAERIPPKGAPAQLPPATTPPKPAPPNTPPRVAPRTAAPGLGPLPKIGRRTGDPEKVPGQIDPPDPRARVGDETLDKAGLSGLSLLLAAEHLGILMAKKRGKQPRASILAEVGDLLLSLERPDFVRKVLTLMAEESRVFDLYPLELLTYYLERSPLYMDGFRVASFIQNKPQIEGARHLVEQPVRLAIPLAAKLKAMALQGGGDPGYHLYPGGPAEYFIELGGGGTFTFQLRAEIRKESLIDRVTITVDDDLSDT